MKRLIVLLGAVGVSASAILVRWSTAPSLVLVLYRSAIASLILTPYVLLRHRRELFAIRRRELLLCLASGVFLGLHFAAYFESLRHTTIAAAVVLVDTEVFFVALGSVLFLRQRLTRRAWTAIAVTFVGSVMVAAAGTGGGGNALWGNLLALSGALFMTGYTVIGVVCRRTLSNTVYTYLVYWTSALTVLVLALASGTPLTGYGAVNFATAAAMAVLCTLLGHSVFNWALKYLPPAFVSTVKLLEPVISALWGLLIFREVPGLSVVLGGALTIFGIALYSRESET